MQLVSSFEDLVQQISWVMTTPTAASFLIVLAGWLFARRHTVTGMLQAAGGVGRKHHSAFHRVFATARWSLDEMGMAVLALAWCWPSPGRWRRRTVRSFWFSMTRWPANAAARFLASGCTTTR